MLRSKSGRSPAQIRQHAAAADGILKSVAEIREITDRNSKSMDGATSVAQMLDQQVGGPATTSGRRVAGPRTSSRSEMVAPTGNRNDRGETGGSRCNGAAGATR